jgi:hypothetical protein
MQFVAGMLTCAAGQFVGRLVDLMKALPVILGFVVGIVLAATACSVLNSANESVRRVKLLSDVHDPMRQCLDDIAQTQERGDVALAEQKLRLLRRRWSEYLDGGGRSPELFASEIMELAAPATRLAH